MTTTNGNGTETPETIADVTPITDAPSAPKTRAPRKPRTDKRAPKPGVNKTTPAKADATPTDAEKTASLDALLTGDETPSDGKPKTTGKAKKKPAVKKTRAPKPEIPAGYEAPFPHRTYMLLKTTELAEGESKWAVMCRAHGTIYGKPVASITEGDKIAAKPNRPTWCRKCKAEQAAKADAGE
jgi:hypothetical protein